jgi:DME family drug/metabolite transporter
LDLLPPAFALAAAILFGFSVHLQKLALRDMDAATGTLISVASTAALFWLAAPFLIEWSWWGTRAAAVFALCGLLFPAISQRLQIDAVVHVGPAIAAAMGSFAPLFAVLPAVAFLGESFGLRDWAGLALLIGGLTLTAVLPGRINRGWPLVALLIPLGASFARGIVQPISKVGFAELPSPFFATLVMLTVSLPVCALMRAAARGPRPPATARGRTWFAVNGIVVGLGILLLQAAISGGEVTTAAPLVSTTPLWALVLGLLVFRHESLRPWHGVVALLVAAGAALIVSG